MILRTIVLLAVLAVLSGCGDTLWNDPYPAASREDNALYAAFVERPKRLDPALSYTSDEWDFITQIYEPPLQYHYLKRPYELIPLSAAALPVVRYFDAQGNEIGADSPPERVARSEFEIHIRPGIRFQPHPAFAVDAAGKPLYLSLSEEEISSRYSLSDFARTGTRELTADDFVYQIKRLAHPRATSPIFGHISQYIEGLRELAERLRKDNEKMVAAHRQRYGDADKGLPWLDLRAYELSGVTVVDRYTYRIRLAGKYPQFMYWLAMPFFAPIPYEADQFYAQRGMNDGRNITFDWYPVGTGPYMLTQNDPNARMVLERNPNFRGEPYPAEGEPGDDSKGLLRDAGKTMPFVDRVVFSREKEGIPYWNKFLQGYYDRSGIASDNFDQAVQFSVEGQATLTPEMEEKGISLRTSVATSTFYLAFNFLDPVVGGSSDRARKLRQAISIAVDFEEFISIFANGRGIPAMGPIPPGLFGYREGEAGINPVVFDWVDGKPRRKPLQAARELLAQAGYADGRDAKTGQPLVLALDTVARGPGDNSRLEWYRRQFGKLNIHLEIRATDWNRFQEKIRSGNTQMFFLGWNADYPDPENFMFLLNGPQSRAKTQGENAANYQNPEYDRLFERMKNLDNGPERQAIIDRMLQIAREDAPWAWGYHPKDYSLAHQWVSNAKPNQIARNGLKYQRVDAALRAAKREVWNQPVLWPIGIGLVLLAALAAPAIVSYRRRERMAARAAT
jgi:ABC-type transport system substrate-binding protein